MSDNEFSLDENKTICALKWLNFAQIHLFRSGGIVAKDSYVSSKLKINPFIL